MNVGIVGGGLAGLATASALCAAGHNVTVYEASDRLGGRMGTTTMEGHPVDLGFHVLHTAYPALKRWVDLAALEATPMDPSTEVILPSQGKRLLLGDALRRPSTLLPTLRSVGPFNALRLLRWRQRARGRDLEAPLDRPSQSIDAGLADQGFSEGLRQRVLHPLFAGITLDPQRKERAAFATFTWGAMANGSMVMPKDGIV
ncbi:MAG: phytoene dehydrogenase, partial [Euryarchaeota archaeon]|nr:phytoene dehydrogenase [Euryarchaeota archaeon]